MVEAGTSATKAEANDARGEDGVAGLWTDPGKEVALGKELTVGERSRRRRRLKKAGKTKPKIEEDTDM